MADSLKSITRREALERVAWLLGGAIAVPTVAGVLAGCGVAEAAEPATWATWAPRTLSAEQSEAVLIMGEIILPQTDTPGARAAQVDRFIDAMLSDYYPEADRRRFLAGLERVEARAQAAFGARFGALPAERRLQLVQALNRQAFPDAGRAADGVGTTTDARTGQTRTPAVGGDWHADDSGPRSFFRTLKELVLVGYYTSVQGATRELRVNPMGIWRADVPYGEIGTAWA